jgi:hypothetical protein
VAHLKAVGRCALTPALCAWSPASAEECARALVPLPTLLCLSCAGDNYEPAPDLDHLNPDLRAAIKDWLKWLQEDIGFGGWRLDFVKGYGARFVEEYIAATVGGDMFNVGEFWVDMDWCGCELNRNQDAARQVCAERWVCLCCCDHSAGMRVQPQQLARAGTPSSTKLQLQITLGTVTEWRHAAPVSSGDRAPL